MENGHFIWLYHLYQGKPFTTVQAALKLRVLAHTHAYKKWTKLFLSTTFNLIYKNEQKKKINDYTCYIV